MFIDSHAHLTSPQVINQVEEIIQRAKQHKIVGIVNICTDHESLNKGMILAKRHRWIFNAAAVTPHDVEKIGELFFSEVAQYAREGELVAIGETGLDYYHQDLPKDLQRQYLHRHLDLAVETKLPLIFHCREAFQDLFEIADQKHPKISAALHCFSGEIKEARQCLKRGWLISLSGIVTFKKATLLREVAAYVPLDALLIETDTPYLAPQSHRGQVNEPAFIVETAQMIAQVKGVSLDKVATATTKNAAQFFSFPKHVIDV